jgi:hypothetical protein
MAEISNHDLPEIVSRRLRSAAHPAAHPEANLITAFVERTLDPQEQAEVLQHLAHCEECREVVARALPQAPEAAISQPLPVSPAWLSWPVLRWGAAAACVAVVGAAVGLHYQSRSAITSSRDVAVVQSAHDNVAANPPASVATETAPTSQIPPAGGKSKVSGKAASSARSVIPGRTKDDDDDADFDAHSGSKALSNPMPNVQAHALSAMIARSSAVPANVTPRWTLSSDGMLQRSIDFGKSWETILVTTPGSLRALTANGFDIWVGGAKGALYHSTDAGQHWMQVQPVDANEPLSSDIIGIQFTDLQHGTVTTSDQQTWATADAGGTWQKQ